MSLSTSRSTLAESQILAANDPARNWEQCTLSQLIDYVLQRYHEPNRAELRDLLELAERVERFHEGNAQCPVGLTYLLGNLGNDLVLHMYKEEQVLFPMFLSGQGHSTRGPVQMMGREHTRHGTTLGELRRLTNDYAAPVDACATWKALYLRLSEFERALKDHVAFEQYVLFPRGMGGT